MKCVATRREGKDVQVNGVYDALSEVNRDILRGESVIC